MIDFAPGMRTIIRDEEWMVKKIETNSLGNKTLYCVGISPLVKDREAIFLTDLEEIQIVDPAEVKLVADTSPFYKRALLYLESQWRQQIPTDANLHIGHKAAMDLMPYQLDPAKLALQRPRQRILIADTVGLGKTLEAGILMSELIARGKGKRILVVTVKSMMTQFQKEMWNRFTIPLVRLDSNRIQKIRANLPSNYNPFFYYDKTIVSIDTLKRDVEYRTHLENAYWDIIVIDEAQNVAERGDHQAQRSRLAKLLADRSDTMIMLSATPHDGRAKSFASLMNMLDPTAIADPQNYTPEDIKGLCIRRFKKDVKDQVSGSFLERKITLERCNASAKEEYAFDIFAEMQLEMDLGKTKGTGQLFKTSLEKSLFSSPAACIKSIEARLKKLYKKYTADDIKDIHLLENLKTALEAITPADFTRYQKLLDLIRSKEYAWNPADSGDRVVIFTERIETMKYLAERLRKDLGLKANAIQEISGGMSDAEQQRIVEDFGRTESPVRVLVASDVASEGLNLHYLSHRLIHFDIPWSLMVFQQRNGRIDRYGQQNRPDIRYMLIESDDKFVRSSVNLQVLANIKALVGNYLKSLGYPEAKPEVVAVDDSLSVPVYLEMTKSNGAPLLWVLLSASKESDAGIMESFVFNANDVDDDAAGTLWEMIVKAVNDQTHFTNADFVFLGTIFGSWIPRTSNAHLAIHSAILASELKAGGAVAVCAVLNDEKDRRTDKYEQEWNGLWRFYNVMQFSDEFIAVSSVGMSHMDYLALPVAINADSDTVAPVAAVDDAWNAIKELLFDDDAKAFVEIAKDAGVPAPDEDNIGYEVEGGDGEVVAAVEIAWPDRRIGFMTAEQAEDKEKLEKLGWRILNLLDAANMDVASYFGGDNQ